ncbi:trans-1,2-dihydrobenzene-1,2-diol dehydrogenase-like isoform X2 [Pomacea canaliculata]|uniref:trans-1,2-dihydrobenzene-1,2-diol dehydrogenase-like isoform X2 n=1 Tax=Pomacea canaliculata TaxID=400727 RepID=UPI000D72FA45|nr:trans-1,2-dihydrobenzene-1,2-diol dehydrogenase-like isoform X2 [Pomacea canaliculata]
MNTRGFCKYCQLSCLKEFQKGCDREPDLTAMRATRWGICTAGKISHDFCGAIRALPSAEHQITAVAARCLEDAQSFAAFFSIPRAYGSYEELAQDDDVDVIYVATIHPYHHAVCRLFLQNNRNILCEKPLTLSLLGTQELLAEAQARRLFFMEGYWSRCFPVYDRIRQELRKGTLGDVRLVIANICLPLDDVPRIRQKCLGGGGLMDIGCYAVQAANIVFPGKPEKIEVQGSFFEEGVDAGGSITLRYSGGGLASLCYHTAVADGCNRLAIMGSKGNIVVPGHFWCPDRLLTPSGEQVYPFPEFTFDFLFDNSIGFIYEINCVRECLTKGYTESPVMPHEDTETIMYILEEIQRQLGVSYDFP